MPERAGHPPPPHGERAAWFQDQIGAWNEGRLALVDEWFHDDFELHTQMLGIVKGKEGIEAWMREIDEQFERWELLVDQAWEPDGERLVATGKVNLRGRGSGVAMEMPTGWILDFAPEGRLRRWRNFRQPEEMLRTAGLDQPHP